MKIAVFLPNWVGDVVMATSAIRTLHEHYPAARLIGVCKPYVREVLDGAPWFEQLVSLDSKGPLSERWPSAAASLWRENVNIALLLANTFRSAFVAWVSGCRRRIGFNRYLRGSLLTDRLEPVRDDDGKLMPSPIIDDYNRLVEQLGCPDPGYRMKLYTTTADEIAADEVWDMFGLSHYNEVICFNPGGAFGSAKHWPSRSFARLARQLTRQRGCGILVLCGPKERDMARQIVRQAQVPGVYSLADHPLSLGLTKSLIKRSSLLITTDSGPRHFAAAFNRPVITLFGPTHIEWTETYYPRAINLQKKVPCGPCQLRVCPIDHACMVELEADEVMEAAAQLLTEPATTLVGMRKAS